MGNSSPIWDHETLFTSGDEYFSRLIECVRSAQKAIEFETYIYEKGVLGDRVAEELIAAAKRGVRVRMIVDGWGSPGFFDDYWPRLRDAGVRVRFYRVPPWILKRVPGDPRSLILRTVRRLSRVNHGTHRKFCLVDHEDLWLGSFNVSDVHLSEVNGDEAWKDIGVHVRGTDVRFARRAFQRAWRGWIAINLPARSPGLLLMNDSYLHSRTTRIRHLDRLREARQRVWLATPYFVPIGRVFRLLASQAKRGVDVRLIIPRKNDVWVMKWMSAPLLRQLAKKGVKVFIYGPRFSHQKVFIADDWVWLGSTNLNHRSYLHDLEMDVVLTHPDNRQAVISGFERDQALSLPLDDSSWAHPPLWKRVVGSIFLLMKYFA